MRDGRSRSGAPVTPTLLLPASGRACRTVRPFGPTSSVTSELANGGHPLLANGVRLSGGGPSRRAERLTQARSRRWKRRVASRALLLAVVGWSVRPNGVGAGPTLRNGVMQPNKRFKLTRLGWSWSEAWSAAYSRGYTVIVGDGSRVLASQLKRGVGLA